MDTEQAERIGELYGQALANFDDLGGFQLALSNLMTYRSYNWDADEFEEVLSALVESGADTNPPWFNDPREQQSG